MNARQRTYTGLRRGRRARATRPRPSRYPIPAFVAYWGVCAMTGKKGKLDSTIYYQVSRNSGNREMVRWLPKHRIEKQTYEGIGNAYKKFNVS